MDGPGIDSRWCHWRFFPWFFPTKPCALRSTQPLKMSTRDFFWGKGGRCVWLTTTTLVVPNVEMIWGLNLTGTPRATSACCGTILLFNFLCPFYNSVWKSKHVADRRKNVLRVCYRRKEFLISNFRRVLNVAFLLLGDSPASEFYMPTFWNTLSVPYSFFLLTPPMKMEQIVPKRRHIKFRHRGVI